MIIVTGGAGFIGSNIVKGLNDRGRDDILVVDNLTNMVKFKNIQGKNTNSLSPGKVFFLASSRKKRAISFLTIPEFFRGLLFTLFRFFLSFLLTFML